MTINGATINGAEINGSGLTDEEQYQLWLRDPSAAVVHLVEVEYGGYAEFDPFPIVSYILKLSDLPFPGYRAVVESLPSFSRQISDTMTGAVSAGIGDVVLSNLDGSLDLWPQLHTRGRQVRIYHGHPSWEADRFRRVATCACDGVSTCDTGSITIKLRPLDYTKNEPIQTNLIAAGPNTNAVIPITLGTCFNIEPVLVDAALATYQYHDGANVGAAIGVPAVRDGGIDFQTAAIAISSVNAGTDTLSTATAHGFFEHTRVRFSAGTPPAPLALSTNYWVVATGLTTTAFQLSTTRGGAAIDITGSDTGATATGYHWTDVPATGHLYLDSTPAGQLTLDAVGYLSTTADILPWVLGASNIDTTSQARLAAQLPGAIGVYIRDRRNRLDVAEQICAGLGAWYGYDRQGMLRMGVVESYLSALWIYYKGETVIDRSEIMPASLRIERFTPPTRDHRILYQRNWTRQSALFSGVTDANRALYTGDGLIGYSSSNYWAINDVTGFVPPDVTDSVYSVDPDDLAFRADVLGDIGHCVYSIQVGRLGVMVDVGDHVFVDVDRYMTTRGSEISEAEGTFAGRPSTCVRVEDRPSDGVTVLHFHTWFGATYPAAPL